MKLFDSYIPRTDGQLYLWGTTYKEKLGQVGPQMGLSHEKITQLQESVQLLLNHIQQADIKKVEYREATAAKRLAKREVLKKVRAMSRYMKTLTGYSANLGKELGIVAPGQPVDLAGLQPSLRARSVQGHVLIRFIKYGAVGVSIYMRLKGHEEWLSLGRARTSPFADKTPLAEPGKPEIREYRIRCYDGIKDIGLWSDIVSVVYGG